MENQWLPAPFIPDRKLVYAKDVVPPMSFLDELEAQRPVGEVGEELGDWEYTVPAGSPEFAHELGEYVHKFTAISTA